MPFKIVRNDITKMQVDAIVNTANPNPGYGAGIDTAVYEAAGKDKLLEKRQEIGVINPGDSVITEGFRLPTRYIIHTVGTSWKGGDAGEEDVIRNCYRSVFKVAVDNDIYSLAIPLLASGSYGFPKGIALRIALSEIEKFLQQHEMDVVLVVFDKESVTLSSELYGDIDKYINDNYVDEKNQIEYSAAPLRDETTIERPGRNRFPFIGGMFRRKSDKAVSGNPPESSEREQQILKGNQNKTEAFEDLEYSDSACFPDEDIRMSVPMASMVVANERSLEDVIKNLDKTFMEMVFSFADAKGLTDVEVQKRANLDRKAFSKLKCGTTKNPSKSTALALAIALELNLDDTKDLLSRAGLALSPCSKQDVIVRYFIEKEAYDIYEINVALFEHGEQLLGSQVS